MRGDARDVADPILEVGLHLQPPDDPAGDDSHGESEAEIEQRDAPAEQAEQQRQRHFVHHRRGDQERERHAQGHAGLDEADEERHRRARAERGDDTEACGHDVGDAFGASGQQRPRALWREGRVHHAHHEHDPGEQQQHLGRVVQRRTARAPPRWLARSTGRAATKASDAGTRAQ